MSIVWDKSYETGIADIDSQHQILMGIIGRFGEQICQQGEIDWAVLDSVLTEVTDYAELHFRDEEALMAKTGVDPAYQEQHKQLHWHFLEEVNQMQVSLSLRTPEYAQRLFNFLMHWLVYHILGDDQVLTKQITAIENGTSPAEARAAAHDDDNRSAGPLLSSLQELVHIISERNRELIELNATLEAKVAGRTHELSLANRQLENLAMTDVLTGLPNRRHALQRLTSLWNEAVDRDRPLAVMMIDADGFKPINDTYGHDAGDVVLKTLAQNLRDNLRNDDVVCRLGGDEFLVICPNTNLIDALRVASTLHENIAAMRVSVGDNGIWHGSISVGVAARHDLASSEALIKLADDGVYAAKRGGRNRVETLQTMPSTSR